MTNYSESYQVDDSTTLRRKEGEVQPQRKYISENYCYLGAMRSRMTEKHIALMAHL